MKIFLLTFSLLSLGLATPAVADIVHADDVIIQTDLCVGGVACVDGEVFAGEDIKIKSTNPEILFLDTSSGANNAWALNGDDDAAGASNSFSINNRFTNSIPFAIAPDAPSSALWINEVGFIGLGTTLPLAHLHVIGNVIAEGAFTAGSDRNNKTNIRSLDAQDILDKIVTMSVSKWSYKSEQDVHHIGPMAQDFYAAFGLGATSTGITSIDTAGVAFAAIQALNQKLVEQNLSLELRVAESEQRAKSMEQRVAELEQQNQRIEELVMRIVMDQAEPVAMK